MTNPTANLRAVEVRAQGLSRDWSKFRQLINQRKQPASTSGGGDGRGSDVSDPTGNAVVHISHWEQYELDAAELTKRILDQMIDLENMLNKVLKVQRTADDKAKDRCSGKVDATCTENASVGPSGRADRAGLCLKCYWSDYRAKQKVDA